METRNLPCRLTWDEKNQFAARTAQATVELAKLEVEKKASAQHFSGLIKEKQKQLGELSICATTGIEYRQVTVYDVPDRVNALMKTIRSDTGEVIATAHMTPKQQQMSLDELTPPGMSSRSFRFDDDGFDDEVQRQLDDQNDVETAKQDETNNAKAETAGAETDE